MPQNAGATPFSALTYDIFASVSRGKFLFGWQNRNVPMEEAKTFISQRQLQGFMGMGLVEAGKITLQEGAEKIGRSYRQTKRSRKRVQGKGVKGFIHENTENP